MPHISITTAFGLVLVDLAVLIYFIHHIATQIQLPQVIAGIAKDLAEAWRYRATERPRSRAKPGRRPRHSTNCCHGSRRPAALSAPPRAVICSSSGTETLVRIATEADAVIRLPYRPGHFLVKVAS